MYKYKIIDTTSFVEPVSLADAKNYCEIDSDYTYKDVTLQRMLTGAREQGELITSLSFGLKTIQFTADSRYDFPFTPVVSITSVVDQWGNNVTNEDVRPFYLLDGRIIWSDWYVNYPTEYTVVYVAGYATPGDVPAGIKNAILKLTRTMYEHPNDIEITRSSGALDISENSIAEFNRYQLNPLF